ncbi:MAG: hypothetical protein H6698_04750 [Myxococcales bacterium]|nr:hypothetical protein [Myxococcales bacterium]MCB9533611.1 hypothetical protein [Myxococcales bacterium]
MADSKSSRAITRATNTLLCLAIAAGAGACSLIIDVPADCDDTNCLPYVCEADGIACKTSCAGDDECSDGFLCDDTAQTCQPTGCVPVGQTVDLAGLPRTISEFDFAVGDGNDEQLIVIASHTDGLGIRRYNVEGALVADAVDATVGLIKLESANVNRQSFRPRVDWTATGADGGNSPSRFTFSWRRAAERTDSLRMAQFVPSAAAAPAPLTLVAERDRTEIATHQLVPVSLGYVAAWRAKADPIGAVFAYGLDATGTSSTDEATELSPDNRYAEFSGAARQEDLVYVVYTTAGGGVRNVVGLAVDPDAHIVGGIQLRADQAATDFEVDSIEGASMGSAATIAWLERASGETTGRFVVLDESVSSSLSQSSTVVVPPGTATDGFSDVSALRIAAASRGFALGWLGSRDSRYDIWVRRFDASGSALFGAFPVALDGAVVRDFKLETTSDGFDVLWLEKAEDAGDSDRLRLRRFSCAN